MTNGEMFYKIFHGIYATEMWSKKEADFIKWLNSEYGNYDDLKNSEPKKVKCLMHTFYSEEWKEVHYEYICPTCDNTIDDSQVYKGIKYCPNCGQRLDWNLMED